MYRKDFYLQCLLYFNVSFTSIGSAPNFGFLMFVGNGHIFSKGVMSLDYEPTIGHPTRMRPASKAINQLFGFFV